jgi:hypothetical protein
MYGGLGTYDSSACGARRTTSRQLSLGPASLKVSPGFGVTGDYAGQRAGSTVDSCKNTFHAVLLRPMAAASSPVSRRRFSRARRRCSSLAAEPERGDLGCNLSARKAVRRVRRIEVVGLCDAGGRFSRNFGPKLRDHRSGPSVSGCSWRVFTTCHFIVVISAQQGCGKDGKSELPGKDSTAIGRNTCGGPSTVLCGTATSAARMDDHVASVSAQTILGGVLGGNLAFYTMITPKAGL